VVQEGVRTVEASAPADNITILPLGYEGHSCEELLDVTRVAVQGFFVACYDASSRTCEPQPKAIEELTRQVYDDLALRYGPGQRSFLLVAREACGTVVGCIGVEASHTLQLPVSSAAHLTPALTEPPRPVAYMSNLAVLASCRGRGVGRRLILEAEALVVSRLRLQEVALMVNAENFPARRLYESLGYSLTFEDAWAVRAIASGSGGIDKVRVQNLGYSHRLLPRNVHDLGLGFVPSPIALASPEVALSSWKLQLTGLWSMMAGAVDAFAGALQQQSSVGRRPE